MKVLKVLAPAKLNLTLEILAKRSDGFHEIRSVIQTINFCDSLRLQLNQNVKFKCNMFGWNSEQSLVSKAVNLLRTTTGCSKGAIIEIDKRIPLSSGLGGDSSDASAILRGLNRLWVLGLSREELQAQALQLGSDVAFFLYGGTVLTEGRGEIVTPLPPLPRMWIVLVVPDIPKITRKTEQLYASLNHNHYTDGQFTQRMAESLKTGREFKISNLFNTFENVAFTRFSKLKVYSEHIRKIGASNVQLAGSGPTIFAIFKDMTQAKDLYIHCRQQGLESYLTDTLPALKELK